MIRHSFWQSFKKNLYTLGSEPPSGFENLFETFRATLYDDDDNNNNNK